MTTLYKPTILFLGCGYTLLQTCKHFSPEDLLLTASSISTAGALTAKGYTAEVLNILDKAEAEKIFVKYPSLQVVVDSVPPLRGVEGATSATGACNIAEVIKQTTIKRVIYLSTTGVYRLLDGSVVNEETPVVTTEGYGRDRVECENAYFTLHDREVTALRIPQIYGPGRGIGIAMRAGRYALIDGGNSWSNRVQVDDLAGIIATLVRLPGKPPPILCVADNEPALSKDVVAFYVEKFNLTPPPSITREEAVAKGSFTRLANQRVSNKLLRESLGYNFKYPSYREGAETEFLSR